MAPAPLIIVPASVVVAGDRVPAFEFGSTTWLEVVQVLQIGGEVEISFGPGADYRLSASALVPVARMQAGG